METTILRIQAVYDLDDVRLVLEDLQEAVRRAEIAMEDRDARIRELEAHVVEDAIKKAREQAVAEYRARTGEGLLEARRKYELAVLDEAERTGFYQQLVAAALQGVLAAGTWKNTPTFVAARTAVETADAVMERLFPDWREE